MDTQQPARSYRVVYVGPGREMTGFGWFSRPAESEREWRKRLAAEQQTVCNEMAADGFRLDHVQPVHSSRELHGDWTEGVWLYFVRDGGS